MAVLVGGAIGLERQIRDKAAGFRTIILVCLGTTMFTIFALEFKGSDPARVAAGIVTGIGFLGAGVIIRNRGQITGMTTAATVWITSALGIGIGLGNFEWSIIVTAIVLIILWFFPIIERLMGKPKESFYYTITSKTSDDIYDEMIKSINSQKLYIISKVRTRSGEHMTATFKVFGSTRKHEKFIDYLFTHKKVTDYKIE